MKLDDLIELLKQSDGKTSVDKLKFLSLKMTNHVGWFIDDKGDRNAIKLPNGEWRDTFPPWTTDVQAALELAQITFPNSPNSLYYRNGRYEAWIGIPKPDGSCKSKTVYGGTYALAVCIAILEVVRNRLTNTQ